MTLMLKTEAEILGVRISGRKNLVTIKNMANVDTDVTSDWGNDEFDQLIDCIVEARKSNHFSFSNSYGQFLSYV